MVYMVTAALCLSGYGGSLFSLGSVRFPNPYSLVFSLITMHTM